MKAVHSCLHRCSDGKRKNNADLIDALPDAADITEDNAEDVEAQLDAIDEAKLTLTEEERDELDFTKYDAAIQALDALAGMALASVPMLTTGSGTALSATGGSLSSGAYYLATDITLSTDITIPSGATVTIDLNGNTLTGTGSGSVITVEGTLTLSDSSTAQSGKVTGGTGINSSGDRFGGGVYDMSSFTITGGTISNNTAASEGGGVYLVADMTSVPFYII